MHCVRFVSWVFRCCCETEWHCFSQDDLERVLILPKCQYAKKSWLIVVWDFAKNFWQILAVLIHIIYNLNYTANSCWVTILACFKLVVVGSNNRDFSCFKQQTGLYLLNRSKSVTVFFGGLDVSDNKIYIIVKSILMKGRKVLIQCTKRTCVSLIGLNGNW